jgi:DNA topoisomerase-1
MKRLVIVESPAKAKTISKYLDDLSDKKADEYTVRASVGHVRDLPKSNRNAIDIENDFEPRYEIVKGKEKVIEELTELAHNVDEVLLATDPDREGEAIAWHLVHALGIDPKKAHRVRFHEITKDAITEAIKHPENIDENLRRAPEARRVLDRLVGYDLSGLIWKKLRYGLSAGRVQSPALRILMEREREIRAFVPEDYWVITADVENGKKTAFTLTCAEEPKTEHEANRILEVGGIGSWNVTDIKETEAKRSPRAPFTTSTLQQAASTRLGFAPSRTMGIAQRLYENGLITYMRTDSTTLSTQAQAQIASAIEKEYGKENVRVRNYKTKSRSAQEAHEAIRPTVASKKSAGANDDQKKLYRLIWERALSSQMVDANILKTKITAQVTPSGSHKEIPGFYVNGSRVLAPGWLLADPRARGEDIEVPKVAKGEDLTLIEMHSEAKQTQPPGRYSEAGLIKELEKRGIGRPSTYASIMKTLNDRGYVEKEGRTLFPTDTGEVVSDFLENNFEKYISDDFTAEMEDELDEIAEGKRTYEKTLKDFYEPFAKDVQSKESIDKLTNLGEASEAFKCPKCGSKMVIKLGRGGKFMSCAKFPDCDGARTIEGKELKPDEPIGAHPESGEPIYLLHGRFGPYVQVGEKTKENPKPKRASVPKDKNPDQVNTEDALKYLSLPRELGAHPETGEMVTASIGRFGPFIVHQSDFRSLKNDDVYTIELPRALEILAEEKKTRGRKKKEAA